MLQFTDFMAQHLTRGGYTVLDKGDQDVFAWSPLDGKPIWVCYLDSPLEPEQIRRSFEFKGHILYVVDDKLIPQDIVDRESTPMWLRVIHGLYFGRVYTWNGRFLYGLHFDYDNGVINESGIIIPDRLLLIEEGTWLRGWTGNYRTARFYEKAWWIDNSNPFRQSTWQDEWEKKRKEEGAKYRQQYEHKQSYGYYGGTGKNPPRDNTSTGRDFKAEFKACKSEVEAKTLYKKLALEFHPDRNVGKDTTVIMQQINTAWDYMQGWWS